jgi:hypothetical protein
MRRHVAGFASLLSLLAALGAADAPAADRLSPQAILGRMAEAYAECRSYRDTGLVRSTFVDRGRTSTAEKPFATAFERGGGFRYEFTDKATGHRFVAWRDGGDVRVWWDVRPGVERPASLDLAIAGATGISSGSAHTLPALLLAELSGRRLTDLQSLKRLDDGTLGGAACYRIEGTLGDQPMTVWIDRQTFLVRRIDSHRQLTKGVQVDTVTTYEPELDGEIPAEALAFGR